MSKKFKYFYSTKGKLSTGFKYFYSAKGKLRTGFILEIIKKKLRLDIGFLLEIIKKIKNRKPDIVELSPLVLESD